jgi:hypothetical protein
MKLKILIGFTLIIILLAFPTYIQGNNSKNEGSKISQEMGQIDNEKLLKALNDTIIKDKNSEVIKDLKARKLYVESHKAEPGEKYMTADEVNVALDKYNMNIPQKYRPSKDSDIIPGFIDGGGIKKLILDGTYHVDKNGTFVLGSGNWDQLRPNLEKDDHFRWSELYKWDFDYNRQFRGINATWQFYDNIPLSAGTIHNVYTTHFSSLLLGTFIESGTGRKWFDGRDSNWLFHYSEVYSAPVWSFIEIPNPYLATRYVFEHCMVDNQSYPYTGVMYCYDSYSGQYRFSTRTVPFVYGYLLDTCQEQVSDTYSYTPSQTQYVDDVQYMINWVWYWMTEMNVSSDIPLYAVGGYNGVSNYMYTWCSP